VQSFDRIGSARAPPLARRQSCEGEQPVAGFLQRAEAILAITRSDLNARRSATG
jgi:hypothetical protein